MSEKKDNEDLAKAIVKDKKDFDKGLARAIVKRWNQTLNNENLKGVSKSYEMNADNQLTEATIAGYKVIHKKVLKEKNGWRTLVMIEYKIS